MGSEMKTITTLLILYFCTVAFIAIHGSYREGAAPLATCRERQSEIVCMRTLYP